MKRTRKLRVVVSVLGAIPAITSVTVIDGCGGLTLTTDAGADVETEVASDDADEDRLWVGDVPLSDVEIPPPPPMQCGGWAWTYVVKVPPSGTPADPGQLCSMATPVSSSVSARVTLTNYSPQNETADGLISIPSAVLATVIGTPTLTISQTTHQAFAKLQLSNITKTNAGFSFQATWPGPLPHPIMGGHIVAKTTMTIACSDGGVQTVEAVTNIDFCLDGQSFVWVSSGDKCTICGIVSEMAPSPIVSDNKGDDLPLGRVIRLRLVEIARAGRNVLLFAENDAGDDAIYEWRVSEGSLECIANDVMLWTLPPDTMDVPFGQVAVWNEAGAVVENFAWSPIAI